jgi:chlorobactene glucosyltransferase
VVQYFTHYLIQGLIVFQSVVLIIILSNGWRLHRAGRHPALNFFPHISVLIPARDESANIEDCVTALLRQDYPSFDVTVLDDQSSDGTGDILNRLAQTESRLHVLSGQPLPPGWLGKNWACAQLAGQAPGDLFYFTDADTHHHPSALRLAVTALEGEKADFLTGFTRQEVHSWGEKFIVPLIPWALICFTPLLLAYALRFPLLSGAVGQMMLFRRSTYQSIGGHEAIKDSVVEDLSLARRIKSNGYRWRLMDASEWISCRMYHTGQEAYAGLAKNLFAVFEYRVLPYLFVWIFLGLVFFDPPIVLALAWLGWIQNVAVMQVIGCMTLSVLLWLVPYTILRIPPYLALFYPITAGCIEFVAFSSLWLSITGQTTWKGRPLKRARWRWI